MQFVEVSTNLRPSLIQSMVFILAGLLLIIWSDIVLNFIVQLIGVVVILLSTISIAGYFRTKRIYPEIRRMPPFDSYAAVIFGILLMVFPEFFMSILMIIVGVAAMMGAFVQFFSFYQIKKAGIALTPISYVMPILMLVLGCLIIANPFHFANVLLIILFGSTSLLYGLTNVVKYITCKK
ncbi:MAG: DUF308 domain-containing protein [Rikenellaceae bacterium]